MASVCDECGKKDAKLWWGNNKSKYPTLVLPNGQVADPSLIGVYCDDCIDRTKKHEQFTDLSDPTIKPIVNLKGEPYAAQ